MHSSSVLNRKRSDKCSSHVIAMKSSTALSVSPSIVSTSKSAGFSCIKLSNIGGGAQCSELGEIIQKVELAPLGSR